MTEPTVNLISHPQSLYEEDFVAWIDHTAQLLKERRFDEIDWENVIEEIESLGRSDKREVRNRLIVLLVHLLKYAYQPDRRSRDWTSTIVEQRQQLDLVLEDSPSLRNYVTEVFADCYGKARVRAAQETGLPIATVPTQSPFDPHAVLADDWLPD